MATKVPHQQALIASLGLLGAGALALLVGSFGQSPAASGGQPVVTMLTRGPGGICVLAGGSSTAVIVCTRGQLSFPVPAGSQLAFAAVPDPGHGFVNFDDPTGVYISSTGNPLPEQILQSGSIRANFQ